MSFILAFFLGELFIRFFLSPVYSPPNIFGGKFISNQSINVSYEETKGVFVNRTIVFEENGFKKWGNISNPKKIFIVGDSFTEMIYSRKGKEWFSYLERNFSSYDFFVYGFAGYSTYQEYLILLTYYNLIRPDVILIQFCDNDYFGNDYQLEKSFYPAETYQTYRPFLENNKTVLKMPVFFDSLREKSIILDRLFYFVDLLFAKLNLLGLFNSKTTYFYYHKDEFNLDNTKKILELISKSFSKKSKIFIFNVNPFSDPLLSSVENITCIEGVANAVSQKEKKGFIVRVLDRHWNELGNKIAGEYLVDYFKNNSILS